MVNLSVNEAAALSKLAARGVGYSWGLCEEAAAAVRWLSYHNLHGAQWLSTLCSFVDGKSIQQLMPRMDNSVWSSNDTVLCPLICGAAVSDRVSLLGRSWQLTFHNLHTPGLLIPFASQISVSTGVTLELSWDNSLILCQGSSVSACVDPNQVDLRNTDSHVAATVTLGTNASRDDARIVWHRNLAARAKLSDQCLSQLKHYAHRTFAPETEQSRQLGAGAGVSDND